MAELTEDQALALAAHDVPVAPVLDREQMLGHEHFRRRGTVILDERGVAQMGHPARYSVHAPRQLGPVPELDATARGSWAAR
jgi:crotonobetainyl-CoA:carnitine CoA-transferase CaiB-like acyl-CoA transferase